MTLTTKTYDFEVGDAVPIGVRQVLSAGGNVRRNNFEITLAPTAQDRSEFGAYAQDEIFFDRVRLNIGGRVDKFGNLDSAFFSPRLSANFKVTPEPAGLVRTGIFGVDLLPEFSKLLRIDDAKPCKRLDAVCRSDVMRLLSASVWPVLSSAR